MAPFASLRVTSGREGSGLPRLTLLDHLGVVDVLGGAPLELAVFALTSGEQPHALLQRQQLLVGAALVLQRLELAGEVVARELLLDLGRRERLALAGLDLLRHAL